MQELEDIWKYSVEIGHVTIYSGMLLRVSYDEWLLYILRYGIAVGFGKVRGL